MTPTTATTLPKATASPTRSLAARRTTRLGDRVYLTLITLAAMSIFGIIVALFVQMTSSSNLSIRTFGAGFVAHSKWDEVSNTFGILPYIFGTLYSSAIALLIAVPVSVGSAIFLSELAPRWLRTPIAFTIELLAAIPSVVYGLWGIFVLLPFLNAHFIQPISASRLPSLPIIGGLFAGDTTGYCMLSAGIILAIMITPFITAVTRDILRAIPRAQREGSYAIGATWWETMSRVVLPYARSGIIGAVILGLGRALGETMAVTMLIGNQSPATDSGISWSLFAPGYTMSSALANKFNEAGPGLNTSALVEIGLVLFLVTVTVNICARLLVRLTARDLQGGR